MAVGSLSRVFEGAITNALGCGNVELTIFLINYVQSSFLAVSITRDPPNHFRETWLMETSI
jgi:hypothetical protein